MSASHSTDPRHENRHHPLARIGSTVALLLPALFGFAACSGELGPSESSVTESSQPITVPANFTDQSIATGLASPTSMAFAPDGRLFVTQQGGQLRVIKNGTLLSTPFLSVPVTTEGERGLLGVAFDPNFASNNFVYIYYTMTTPAVHNRVSRFTANGDVAASGSEVPLLDLTDLGATNHNGGAMHFGPDGKLFIATGENAYAANAQALDKPLGKILRINTDGSIPSDNPYFSSTSGINRAIWAIGFRNPFTFAFQRGTGRMFVNDVGEASWEEINDGIAGSNYGWPNTEGTTSNPSYRSPLHVYAHNPPDETTGCAITGGTFYNPQTAVFPSSYVGQYFFADFCGNWIRVFNPSTGTASSFATSVTAPVDLDVGPDGLLYYLMRGSGSTTGVVGRIGFATSGQAPTITSSPTNQTVAAGQQVTFSASATGSQPIAYQWQRGTTNISGATGTSYSFTAAAGDSGATFRVVVSNGFGTATSNPATLTVTTNSAPTATITTPPAGTTYRAGDTVSYVGTGTDPESGSLPASAFTWEVAFHHDTHNHPFIAPTSGAKSGTFTIPTTGETSSNVWYRIHLTVQDPAGLTHSVFRDITPVVSALAFATQPAGLQVTVDGAPLTTPGSINSVVGMQRSIGVISPQTVSGTTYNFSGWSDGGAATHAISTPGTNTTYTATFTPAATTGFAAKVNFQTGTTATPSGYLPDIGSAYGNRGNGLSYGWNSDNTGQARERSAWNSPDKLRDTFNHLQNPANPNAIWEIAVPNGSYNVRIVAGDPSFINSVYVIRAESVVVVNGTPDGDHLWLDGSASVTVSDGRLTVSSAAGASNNKINFIEITSTGTPPANQAPTVATAAAASPSPATGTSATLSVLGADDGGESALVYTWATTGTPPAAVGFSANGTNAAKSSVATFTKAGSYTLSATIRDAAGLSVVSPLNVTVNQTLTSIAVTPTTATVPVGTTRQFSAVAADQFGTALASQPSFVWSASGGGSVSGSGLFTAGSSSGGPFTVSARSGVISGTASVTVTGGSTGGAFKINFQTLTTATPAGYLADAGRPFGDRGAGLSYGWNNDNTAQARERNGWNSPDKLFDTFNHLQNPANPNASWEIAVPNGTYRVRMVAGDPSFNDSVFGLRAENVVVISGAPGDALWIDRTATVTVSDGRLSVSSASGSSNNKINLIEITGVSARVFSPESADIGSSLIAPEPTSAGESLLERVFGRALGRPE